MFTLTLSPADVEAALDALTDDGDTWEMPDGRTLRVRIEPDTYLDPEHEINGVDCWGRVAWCELDSTYTFDYVHYHKPRPEGFDGDALKLHTDFGGAFWWQPTLKAWGVTREEWTPERRREEAARIVDLMTYGFSVVILEVLDGTDAYGRPVIREATSLGGIDSLENGYLRHVLSDMIAEVTA